jgi:hypothetical protein
LMIDVFPTKAEANMTINVPLGWHERYNIWTDWQIYHGRLAFFERLFHCMTLPKRWWRSAARSNGNSTLLSGTTSLKRTLKIQTSGSRCRKKGQWHPNLQYRSLLPPGVAQLGFLSHEQWKHSHLKKRDRNSQSLSPNRHSSHQPWNPTNPPGQRPMSPVRMSMEGAQFASQFGKNGTLVDRFHRKPIHDRLNLSKCWYLWQQLHFTMLTNTWPFHSPNHLQTDSRRVWWQDLESGGELRQHPHRCQGHKKGEVNSSSRQGKPEDRFWADEKKGSKQAPKVQERVPTKLRFLWKSRELTYQAIAWFTWSTLQSWMQTIKMISNWI